MTYKYIALEPLYSRREKKHIKPGESIKLSYASAMLLLKCGAIKFVKVNRITADRR